MKEKLNVENINLVNKEQPEYIGFIQKSEDEKLRDDVFRSSIDKLQLFTKMLHRESVLKKAKISRI
jgi:hypothetical protein